MLFLIVIREQLLYYSLYLRLKMILAQILHNIMEVWRAFRPSVYKKLKRMDIMPLEAERLLQEQGKIKSRLPYNRETTDMFTLIGKDEDPLNEYPY